MNKPRSKDPRVLTCENVALYRLHYVPPYVYFRSISLWLHTVLRNSRQTFYIRFRVERILPLSCWTLMFNMKIAIVNILCLQYFDTTSKFSGSYNLRNQIVFNSILWYTSWKLKAHLSATRNQYKYWSEYHEWMMVKVYNFNICISKQNMQ